MGKRPIWVSSEEADVLLTILSGVILTEPLMTGFRRETVSSVLHRLISISYNVPDNEASNEKA
jgi:hypothetical protein